jgi:hypothetical protein
MTAIGTHSLPVLDDLFRLRVDADALIFPSEANTPFASRNWLQRNLQPIGQSMSQLVLVMSTKGPAHHLERQRRLDF